MKYFLLALQFLPHVLAAVQAVELALVNAAGQAKKDVVMAVVLAAAQVGERVPEDHVKLISALIDTVVSALNVSGIFKHVPTV